MELPENKEVYLNSETIIQPQAYAFLKRYASKLSPVDRLVTITFSEYKLADVVPMDYKYDDQPPPNFIVVGVHFINVDRYQPIGTLFLYDESYAKGKTPTDKDLADCLRLYILAIARIPLTVVSTIAPPSGTFKKALSNLIRVTDMTSFDGPLVYSVFEVKNIVHLYDPPSLLRAFRNFFMHQDIEFKINEKIFVATWKDIVALFARDKLPFLEKEHICPTLKISHTSYAVPIFSNKVRNAISDAVKSNMLPIRAIGSSVLLKIFNDLFDSFNSCCSDKSIPTRQLISKKSYHHTFWDNTLKILASIFFVDNNFKGNNNIKNNFKYSDSQKSIADDPMGDIYIKVEPLCKTECSVELKKLNDLSRSDQVDSDQFSIASANNECAKKSQSNLHHDHHLRNSNGKLDISTQEERKQAKMSTLRMNFLDGLRNTSVVEFKDGKNISRKKSVKTSNSSTHLTNSKFPATETLNHNNNNEVNSTTNNENKSIDNSNGQTNKMRSQEDETGLKRFIVEFSKCDVKDCYGFFEDKDCDIEMEYMPLLEKGKDGKNRTKQKHYESVSSSAAINPEVSVSENDVSAISTIKLAVNELKEIEDIVKSSEDVTKTSNKRSTKHNRKKVKSQKKETIDALHEIDNRDHGNIANGVNDKENDKNYNMKTGKTNSTYPLNNSLEKERTSNSCIKRLNFFTENDTNSNKILIKDSHVKKTDVKSNNIKTNCDITNNLNICTNNIKKKKVDNPHSFQSESEQVEKLNTLCSMNIDICCPEHPDIFAKKSIEKVNCDKVANGTQNFLLDKRPLLPDGKLEPDNCCKVEKIAGGKTSLAKSSLAKDNISNGIKEMLEVPGFESDSEPEMPSIPISDILEKLEASDKQPVKLKYVKHEITSNWMSNIQGMQLIAKRLKREGLKQFSSRVFNVDCTHSYVSHVRDANHRRIPNAASSTKSMAKLLDPFYAVLAMSKGTAVLLP